MDFQALFQPGNIGRVILKNRLTVPAMLTCYANGDGSLSERFIRYYEERAIGGFSLIVTEDTAVTPAGAGFPCLPGIWHESQLFGHAEMVKRVHAHDAKIFCQIYHAGRECSRKVSGLQPVAPSAIPDPVIREVPHELDAGEIRHLQRAFVNAAIRAAEVGYDGVELHGAHGYLINQFLSPFSNRRIDEYGGTFENRMRFLLEILQGIKQHVPHEFAVTCKLSCDEFVPGGIDLAEACRIAQTLEVHGCDGIVASGGVYASGHRISAPYYQPGGCFSHLAAGLREAVQIPIIAINRIHSPEIADHILRDGKADFVAIGRASMADPAFPRKIRQHRCDTIIPCIACDQGCQGRVGKGLPVSCLVNPRTGREGEFNLDKTAKPQKVMVVGGGIAGMTAAIVAARKGHRVTLWEKEGRLGGYWNQAAVPPCKEIFNSFTVYLQRQLKELQVELKLASTLTEKILAEERPDVLFCATGAKPLRPEISGLASHKNVVFAVDLLAGHCEYGRQVAIIGGGMVGMETAEHLALHGARVTLLARSVAGKDLVAQIKPYLMKSLAEHQVAIHEFCDIELVDGMELCCRDRSANRTFRIEADQIVIAAGASPCNALAAWAAALHLPCRMLGDAGAVGDGVKAVLDGYCAAQSLC